jgi:hypothetical protein
VAEIFARMGAKVDVREEEVFWGERTGRLKFPSKMAMLVPFTEVFA